MHFTRRVIGPETYLYYPYEAEDLIDYQLKMINNSDQNILSKISLKGGSLEHGVTSYLPISLYFKNLNKNISSIKILFLKIINCMEALDHYLLDMNQIVLEKDYIYYDISTEAIRFVYLPLISFKSKDQQIKIKKLCLGLMYEYMSFEDLGHHQNLLEMLQKDTVDIFALKLFLREKEKPVIIKKTTWLHKLFKKNKPMMKVEVSKVSQKKLEVVDKATLVLSTVTEPVLIFGKKRVVINKASFLIGRSPSLNDFSVPEALTMGRVHAEIQCDEHVYYIIDLNTKNGTYINGKRIESQKRYKLHSEDRIEMGQEKAIFE